MKDILSLEEIRMLVDKFYGRIQKDDLLGPIFNKLLRDRWPEHLEKMYRFWQTVLLDVHSYHGSPFPPHANLPVDKKHFDHWLDIFIQTVDENFTGKTAEEAKWRAQKMAEMFHHKIDYYRQHPEKRMLH